MDAPGQQLSCDRAHERARDREREWEREREIYLNCFASASLLLISLLFFVITPSGLGSAVTKGGFFLVDWELEIFFSFVFFGIFTVVVAVDGVFLGLVCDTGFSTWRQIKSWDPQTPPHKTFNESKQW